MSGVSKSIDSSKTGNRIPKLNIDVHQYLKQEAAALGSGKDGKIRVGSVDSRNYPELFKHLATGSQQYEILKQEPGLSLITERDFEEAKKNKLIWPTSATDQVFNLDKSGRRDAVDTAKYTPMTE